MKFILLILFCSTGYVSSKNLPNGTTNTNDATVDANGAVICESARRTYRSAGYEGEDIYTLKSTEKSLKVCGQYKTCCKAKAEVNLVKLSERKRTDLTSPLQNKLNTTFRETASKLKGLLRSLISRSQASLDSMFAKTYGPHYGSNRVVFKSLYNSFHQYLNGSELDLQSHIKSFFAKLHEKVFKMTKPWAKFSKEYENCIYESTTFVKPFGILQEKIEHQTTRSFLASRIFMRGLKEGMEVMTKLLQLPVHDECSIAFMKMTQCSICSGLSDNLKPCVNYCTNVMKGCFAYIIMIQPKWNEFIQDMISLAEKLEGPFSLEAVVEPLGVKISEAIMVFQENLGNVTAKVEERCGKASSGNSLEGRKRRSVESAGDETAKKSLKSLKSETDKIADAFTSDTSKILDELEKETDGPGKGLSSFLYNVDGSNKKEESDFERLLREIKASLNMLRDYWVLLPNQLCKMVISADGNQNCWNGLNTTGYDTGVIGNSVHDLFNSNPEMKLNPKKPNVWIVDEAKKLEFIIHRIREAVNGKDFNCIECTESSSASGTQPDCDENGSGDGEGSGCDGASGVTETTTPTQPPRTTEDKDCENDVNCSNNIVTTGPNDVDNKFNDDNLSIDFRGNKNNLKNPNPGSTSVSVKASIVLVIASFLAVFL